MFLLQSLLLRRDACLKECNTLLDASATARSKLESAQSAHDQQGRIPSRLQASGTADAALEIKQRELAQFTAGVKREFARAQQEKLNAMQFIIKTHVKLQIQHTQQIQNEWQSMLDQINESKDNSE
jgi:hypothetical protein